MYGDKMEKIRFQICEKELTLYPAQGENRPLIVFNTVMGDGEELAQAMRAMDAPDCNLLVVGKLQWYHDMTPWSCPPLSKRGPAATGGADAYLETLASEIVPAARKKSGEARRTSASPGTRWLGFLRSMRCTAATASRGWPACPAPCGFRSSGNTCFGMN